jgi:hypothetical protein
MNETENNLSHAEYQQQLEEQEYQELLKKDKAYEQWLIELETKRIVNG